MKVKVIQTRLDSFTFKKHKLDSEDNQKKQQNSINFGKAKVPNLKISENEVVITATTSLSYKTNTFVTSWDVVGLFVIPKDYSESIGDKEGIDKVRKLTSAIIPILMSKFRTYTALLSQEVSTYPVIPEFKVNSDDLSLEKKSN